MKFTWISPTIAALCASLLLAASVRAATPVPTSAKLDRSLAPIAEAAEQHVDTALMERALVRQSIHGNSVLEPRWNTSGQVQVYLHYDPDGTALDLNELENLGATDIKQSPELHVVQAWVPAAALKAAANLPDISRVSLPRYALHKRAPVSGPIAETGKITTEGDQILGAAAFRSATGVTGQGVTVGVISDGDTHISASQKTGDLPANIVNDPNDAGSFKSAGDEGTAMMEIIYDLAPGVKQLGFCGPQSTVDFITCLNDFANNISANVIVDDLEFPGGAMFSDDTFNTAVKSFSSAHPNIRLVAAAGNDAQGYWQGSWAAPAAVTLTSPVTVNHVTYTQAANFGTAISPVTDLKITIPLQFTGDTLSYIVEWNDPWDDKTTTDDPNDYDVVVFDTGGVAVACNQGDNVSTNGTSCTQTNSKSIFTPGPVPIQGSNWTATGTTYNLEVLQGASGYGNPGPNLKILVFDSSNPIPVTVTPTTPGSVFSHAALPYPAEISVGAIDSASAQFGSYNIEPFSALGPVEYGITGGTAQSFMKPDFVAPDCVSVTGAGGFGGSPPVFCGTSAAAPHIAGLIALLMAGYPNQHPYTMLQKAATQPGSPDPNGTFGFGVPILTNLLSAGLYPVPAASISAPADGTSVGTGQMVAFKGSCTAASAVTGVKMDWNFGSGSGIPDSVQANPSVTFSTAGSYTVTLKCTGSSGSGMASVNLTVNAPAKGGGSMDLLSMLALGLLYLMRRRHHEQMAQRS